MRIAAFDLSLTQTGVALTSGFVGVITTPLKGLERLAFIRGHVLHYAKLQDLAVLEGYGFAAGRGHAAREMAELGGVVRIALFDAGIPYVDIPPATLKKFATGKGNANKEEVLASAIRRLGYPGANNNEADALWLLEAASHAYGDGNARLPKLHLDALEKVRWPQLPKAA